MNAVPQWMLTKMAAPLQTAAAAVATWLPATASGELSVGEPLDGMADPGSLIAGGSGVAVVAPFGGRMTGRMVIGLSDELAARVAGGDGEVRLDHALVLEPVIAEAAGAFEDLVGGPLRVSEVSSEEPSTAMAWTGGGQLVGIGIYDGETHIATLAIELNLSLIFGDEPDEDDELETHDADGEDAVDVARLEYQALPGDSVGSRTSRPLDLLSDVEMAVTAELGRTRMTVRDLLSLAPGSVVELDRAAGSPIDLLVNGTLIARGEVVVIDEEFGVRIMEIVQADSPIAKRSR